MKKFRIIARIDVKNDFVIKGIHLEGLRKIGNPNDIALSYYKNGIDEIIFMDAVAAYYDRNSLSEIIKEACKDIFVPITVGGGIRSIEDIQNALDCGADKVAINTEAIRRPDFIKEAARHFGSQCIVASIEAKKVNNDIWEAYYDNGRESSGRSVLSWIDELQQLGAGEIMITSVDNEGVRKGFDISLVEHVSSICRTPLIISGGAGNIEHIKDLSEIKDVDAVALASVLHYDLEKISNIKEQLSKIGVHCRK